MKIFISYAHVDRIRAEEIASVLQAIDLQPSWDDRIEPGGDYQQELERRIVDCDAFLYLASRDSKESEWCQWELNLAVMQGKPLLPILIREGAPLPACLEKIHALNAPRELDIRQAARLVKSLVRVERSKAGPARSDSPAPQGFPSRCRVPLGLEYRTVSQAFFTPPSPNAKPWKPPAWEQASRHETIIGIDLGTSTSSAAVYLDGQVHLIPNDLQETSTPSAVAIAAGGEVLVGRRAIDLLIHRPDRGAMEIKRLFGVQHLRADALELVLEVDGVSYTAPQLASCLLRQLYEDAVRFIGSRDIGVVLTAPAYFLPHQHAALIQAAKLAGLHVFRVLQEPVAACVGCRATKEEALVVVYDLGGGTFDVSVMAVDDDVCETRAVAGDTRLGGADFDRVLVRHCLTSFERRHGIDLRGDASALLRLHAAAVRCKLELSVARWATVQVNFVAHRGGQPIHLVEPISQELYNELTAPLVARTLVLARRALRDAEVSAKDVDQVIVVGRAVRSPSVAIGLADLFSHKLYYAPDEVVARGAAVQGGVLSGAVKDLLLLSATARGLGIQVRGGEVKSIVPRGNTIPTSRFEDFHINVPKQRGLVVRVMIEGDDESTEPVPILEMQIDTHRRSIQNKTRIWLDIDANSVLELRVETARGRLNRSLPLRGVRSRNEFSARTFEPVEDRLLPEVWEHDQDDDDDEDPTGETLRSP